MSAHVLLPALGAQQSQQSTRRRARTVAAAAKDWSGLRVAYQASC
jgi:hypothetical protein